MALEFLDQEPAQHLVEPPATAPVAAGAVAGGSSVLAPLRR